MSSRLTSPKITSNRAARQSRVVIWHWETFERINQDMIRVVCIFSQIPIWLLRDSETLQDEQSLRGLSPIRSYPSPSASGSCTFGLPSVYRRCKIHNVMKQLITTSTYSCRSMHYRHTRPYALEYNLTVPSAPPLTNAATLPLLSFPAPTAATRPESSLTSSASTPCSPFFRCAVHSWVFVIVSRFQTLIERSSPAEMMSLDEVGSTRRALVVDEWACMIC